MIVSIMQPYFFPYLGYFQLIANSDIFVFFDDAQYIKRSFMNRNRILNSKGEVVWITLPVAYGNHTAGIMDRTYVLKGKEVKRIIRSIKNAYRNAPEFDEFIPEFEAIMSYAQPNVAEFNINLIKRVSNFMGLSPTFVRSSQISQTAGLWGQDRVIDMCRRLGATRYVNPFGGTALYDSASFRLHGVELEFLRPTIETRLDRFPYLSIIHTLLTVSYEGLAEQLRRYEVTPGQ
jgi:hypothetical protein